MLLVIMKETPRWVPLQTASNAIMITLVITGSLWGEFIYHKSPVIFALTINKDGWWFLCFE